MYRKLGALVLCLVVSLAAACKDEPVSQPDPVPAPRSVPGLPTGTGLTHVEVTKVATPSSIDPQLLPVDARKASAMAGLTPEQKICIDDTIYQTIQGDRSIATDQGKLASVMGSAMALCGGDSFASTLVKGLVGSFGLTTDQAACVQQKMGSDPDIAAQVLGAVATADFAQIDDAFAALESACNFDLGG